MQNTIIGIMSFLLAFNVCAASTFSAKQDNESTSFDPLSEAYVTEASVELDNENLLFNIDSKELASGANGSKQTGKSSDKTREYYGSSKRDLNDMLGGVTDIIKNYAETEGIEASSKQLFLDLSVFSNDLNKRVETYKDKDLYSHDIDKSIEKMQELANKKGVFVNPFEVVQGYFNLLYNFYGEMGSQNLLQNIKLSENPSIPAGKRFLKVKERKHVVMKDGVVTEDIYFKEVEEIKEVITELMPQEEAQDVLKYL
ncbi:MAG: hypothetical protein A2Y03_10390 [Omnitrophica WOR_2 bacterium GWF2_38_59]|nr:MAG: hypothetical protein A2Y03_10390 [Omnitrophica WOR_2 bacterium GWF2_38_59]OGX51331.1 MAG: hypothetical protein A2243_09930 [Omnitrophica WOR_2 bacterium RIFOXYA2_FULL_38_17]OGX55732.1 MAG: hypothetical protein A2306_02620 [Omnitrophica WOR_2 bacterium RIFOXYB2_FULL_38_16]HBG61564.1 hypothetical protein [Candidatus Omnitrophota bacterium]